MANGHGGARVGAGRKAHTRKQRWLGGNAGKRPPLSLVAPAKDVQLADAAVVPEKPSVLTEDEARYWSLWAPLATSRGLLTTATAPGFVLLCKWAAAADAFWSCINARGYEQEKVTIDGSGQEHREYKANTLISQWRGAMTRVEQLQARYGIAADGKVLVGEDADTEETQLAELLAVK